MGSVYADQDHHGNRIVNADLTQIQPSSLHPDVLARSEVVAGDGIDISYGANGTVTISQVTSTSSYRQRFEVTDPTAQIPLVVSHGLGSGTVSVTIVEVGSPSRPVSAQVSMVDENTVEILLSGESAGVFEVLVLSDGGSGPKAYVDSAVAELSARIAALESRLGNSRGA